MELISYYNKEKYKIMKEGVALMLELTEKEWGCFNEYLKDLLNVLSEEEAMSICDSKYI